jgi:AraC family transcriptional regulator
VEQEIVLAVERAIETMHDKLDEPITIDDMAKAAMFSKFHFTRIFQRVTGVSPGRFLSALRIQQAKRLLVSTSWNVADISQRVGYSSVGTFSTRFKKSVGLSPTTYRMRGGFTSRIGTEFTGANSVCGTISGYIWSPLQEQMGKVFIGVFPGPIPEERPRSCAILDRPGRYVLTSVPEGEWYVLACAQSAQDHSDTRPREDDMTTPVGAVGPVRVRRNTALDADVWLRPRRLIDPPVLIALLEGARPHPLAVPGQRSAA